VGVVESRAVESIVFKTLKERGARPTAAADEGKK